ncbi:helix-turn-helix domain-containing protein [Streptomyces similanensis]|uniref:MarR family transcriptional regulator n=1 Tax=Streptomyces similanensis TaxID=1274988 RepID=A0ABP9L7N8_9ACTN
MSTTYTRRALGVHANLRAVERLVLVHLAHSAGPDGLTFPDVDRLAAAANVSRSTVSCVLRKLLELGLVEHAAPQKPNAAARKAYRATGGRA